MYHDDLRAKNTVFIIGPTEFQSTVNKGIFGSSRVTSKETVNVAVSDIGNRHSSNKGVGAYEFRMHGKSL